MDRLKRTDFLDELNGKVFLSQDRAFSELARDTGDPQPPVDHYLARGMI
jgi:SulP family sulfate permease